MFDLHIHTTFSDGSDTVDEIIDKVYNAGIDYFSITDHDTALSARTILSSESLKNKIKNYGLTYVTGTEWTCQFLCEQNGKKYSVHILSYDFDPFNKNVIALEKEIKDLLKEKSDYRFFAINQMGYKLSENSMEFLNSRENIRKLDMANVLVNDGYFENVQDAINNCLETIKYPKKYKLDGRKVLKTMSDIGAKMVWAHSIHGLGKKPISYEEIEMIITEMKQYGLSGLECYYSLYDQKEIAKLVEIAKKYNLFITCGSDFHGKNKTVNLAETSRDGTIVDEKNITVNEIFKNIVKGKEPHEILDSRFTF